METTNEIIDYVIHTPHNSNPNVMRGILEKSDEGGGDDKDTFKPCLTITYSGNKSWDEDPTTEKAKYSITVSDMNKIIEYYNLGKNINIVLKTSENEYYTFAAITYEHEVYDISFGFYINPYKEVFPSYLADIYQVVIYNEELFINVGKQSN